LLWVRVTTVRLTRFRDFPTVSPSELRLRSPRIVTRTHLAGGKMPRATINLGESTGQSMVGGRWKFARGYVPGEPNEGLVAQGDATPRAVSACSLKHVSTTTVRSGLMANAIETGVRSRDSTFHRGFWSPPTLRQVSGTRLLCWLPTVLWERRVAPSFALRQPGIRVDDVSLEAGAGQYSTEARAGSPKKGLNYSPREKRNYRRLHLGSPLLRLR